MSDDPLPTQNEEEDEDGYMEGPYYVFTAAYHLKRGYCCGSNCRHCPYGHAAVALPTAAGPRLP